jgi:hypothetical protein
MITNHYFKLLVLPPIPSVPMPSVPILPVNTSNNSCVTPIIPNENGNLPFNIELENNAGDIDIEEAEDLDLDEAKDIDNISLSSLDGVTQSLKQRLSVVDASNTQSNVEEDNWSICLLPISMERCFQTIPCCSQRFHTSCLDEWIAIKL